MPTYATFVKFKAEGLKGIGDIGEAYDEGRKMAQQMGIKSVGAYATLGPYDMMFIYEASDEKAAAGMAVSMAKKWGGETETWTVIPMEEFVKLADRFKA
jgi:uncharacterized protein with GYD domain